MEPVTLSDLSHFWPCLAIDTSTRSGVLVVGNMATGQKITAHLDASITHGCELVPSIKILMEASGLEFKELKSIAVGIGPGSYTGLRVGLAIAKTLADVLAVPVVPVDSMLLSVLNLGPEFDRAGCIADAQRGTVYETIYERDRSTKLWTKKNVPEIVTWESLNRWSGQEIVLTGPGLALIPKLGPPNANLAKPELWGPTPESMFAWLADYAAETPPVDHLLLEPLYIRPSAAEEKRLLAASKSNHLPVSS
jgi:tRNA threonylcarbamoyladenosine biosynthesis protein TsaB